MAGFWTSPSRPRRPGVQNARRPRRPGGRGGQAARLPSWPDGLGGQVAELARRPKLRGGRGGRGGQQRRKAGGRGAGCLWSAPGCFWSAPRCFWKLRACLEAPSWAANHAATIWDPRRNCGKRPSRERLRLLKPYSSLALDGREFCGF